MLIKTIATTDNLINGNHKITMLLAEYFDPPRLPIEGSSGKSGLELNSNFHMRYIWGPAVSKYGTQFPLTK